MTSQVSNRAIAYENDILSALHATLTVPQIFVSSKIVVGWFSIEYFPSVKQLG